MCNRRAFSRKEPLVIVVILAAMSALVIPAILQATEAARESACLGRMSQLKLALWLFEDTKGHFPPAIFLSEEGKAQHSWRVLILPYVAGSNVNSYYRFGESWNSEHNSMLVDHQGFAQLFQCPSGVDEGQTEFTNYVVVQGAGTAFPSGKTIHVKDITDGPENTMLLVESHGLNIHWREPRDLEFDTMSLEPNTKKKPCINSPHPTGPVVSFADRAYYRLSDTITGSDVRALLTISAGDSPKTTDLDRRDGTLGR